MPPESETDQHWEAERTIVDDDTKHQERLRQTCQPPRYSTSPRNADLECHRLLPYKPPSRDIESVVPGATPRRPITAGRHSCFTLKSTAQVFGLFQHAEDAGAKGIIRHQKN